MSIQNVRQGPSAILQLLLVGCSTRRIDSSRLASIRIMNQVAVVVTETRKLSDRKGRGASRDGHLQ